MTRSFFLFGVAAALTLASDRFGLRRRVPRTGDACAGRCATSRRKLRWSSYTAADFT